MITARKEAWLGLPAPVRARFRVGGCLSPGEGGGEDPADLMTKFLSEKDIGEKLRMVGMRKQPSLPSPTPAVNTSTSKPAALQPLAQHASAAVRASASRTIEGVGAEEVM